MRKGSMAMTVLRTMSPIFSSTSARGIPSAASDWYSEVRVRFDALFWDNSAICCCNIALVQSETTNFSLDLFNV